MNKRRQARHAEGLPAHASDYLLLALDIVLLAALALQAVVAGCLLVYGSIPLPASWARALFAEAAGAGLRMETGGVRANLGGAIRIARPELYQGPEGAPFFEASEAVLYLRWPGRGGLFSLDPGSLLVSGGTLHLPAVHSPSGARTPLLEQTSFKLVLEADRLRVESLAARHRAIRVRGALAWPLRREEAVEPEPPEAKLDRLFTLLARGARETEKLSGFVRPTFFFNLDQGRAGEFDGRVILSSTAYAGEGLEAEDLHLETGLHVADGTVGPDGPIRAAADRLALPAEGLEVRDAVAEMAPEHWHRFLAGEEAEVRLGASAVERGKLAVTAPVVTLGVKNLRPVRLRGSAGAPGGTLAFSAARGAAGEGIRLTAAGAVDLLALVPPEMAGTLPLVKSREPPFVRAELLLDDAYRPRAGDFYLQSGAVSVDGVGFDAVHVRGAYRDGTVELEDFLVARGPQWVEGRLGFTPEEKAYAVELRGRILPDDYATLLPPWWGRVFEDIGFDRPDSAYADFSLRGRGDDRDRRFFFGSVEGRDLSFEGVPVDEASLKVRGRGLYVEVFDMDVSGPGGRLRGKVAWTSRPDDAPAPLSTRLDLDAQLSLDALRAVLGPETADVVGQFSSDRKPDLQARGVLFSSGHYPEYVGKDRLHLDASVDGPVSFRGLPLDALRFKLDSRGDEVRLRDIHFGLAGGSGEAEVDLSIREQEADRVRLKGTLRGADRDRMEAKLKVLRDRDEAAVGPAEGPARLDVDLHVEGPADDLTAAEGFGRFLLEDPALGSIQVLGPLSRLLQNTVFGFTTLTLGQARGEFAMGGRGLDFDGIKIDGPRVRIDAAGRFGLDDESLDFRVVVRPFGSPAAAENPLGQVGRVLGPLSGILSFQLSGTVEEPRWRSILDPRNLVPGF